MPIATSQITIIDYNDAISITGFITANQPKTQQYNNDSGTYNPSWAASPFLVLTPSLYVTGTATDIIATPQVESVKWFDGSAPTTEIKTGGIFVVGTTGAKTLTVKDNMMSSTVNGKDFICEVVYRDKTTGLALTCKMTISFNRVISGGGSVDAVAWCPKGNIFKNGDILTLDAECDLWRGSVVDTTTVQYQWYKMDSTVSTDQGGGAGWRKLDATTNYNITDYTTRKIVIPNTAVDSLAVFKCVITDNNTSSPTKGQKFQDTVTIIDQSDPVQISIVSSGGTILQNGAGTSTLTAKVFQAGIEVDKDGKTYSYKWSRYLKDGTKDNAWVKTGKSLVIGDADVDVKATFVVEI